YAGELDRAPKEGPADTVLLTARLTRPSEPNAYYRSRYWVDPSRGCVTLRYTHDELGGPGGKPRPDAAGSVTYAMDRLEQSPNGVWYPTRVRFKDAVRPGPGRGKPVDLVTWFYVDFKAELPDSLFEPRDR